ncbi:MAG: nucleotide sugar dehydrogenase [Micavibrio sp.]
MSYDLSALHVGVVGLGYVGMPLALMLSKNIKVTGFDISASRVSELRQGIDRNCEIDKECLLDSACTFTSELSDIKECNIYIVTVPTPIDEHNKPDLSPVISATNAVASILKRGDIVVYESTVYPGVTEDICGPLLEHASGLKSGKDFFLGYSPERINPGDAAHTVQKITKVVAGQNEQVTELLAGLYGTINNGNIFCATNIRTAEASKAIENAQRDINVAFINEVTMIVNKLGLSAYDVLEAAGTKWNFMKFSPGLVGGHCIGVDPYYLAECAINIGHEPKIILSGREINDGMGLYVANCLHDLLKAMPNEIQAKKILLLGFTFKENINDIRNTKVVDILRSLVGYGYQVDVHDPYAVADSVHHEYGLNIMNTLPIEGNYAAVALLVGHDEYKAYSAKTLESILVSKGIIYDMKGLWRGVSDDFSRKFSYHTL